MCLKMVRKYFINRYPTGCLIVFLFGLGFLCPLFSQAQFSFQYVEVLYDSAWTYKNLQLVPIRFKAGRGGGGTGRYISLNEAMLQKKLM